MSAPLALVVAVSENGVIGHEGKIPWHVREDLQHFKRVTMGHAIIMGRKTHASIGRALPGRRNLVVSRNPDLRLEGCDVFPDLATAIADARRAGDPEPRIVGGGVLYAEALPLATRLYLTRIHLTVEGDTHFPDPGPDWRELGRTSSTDGRATFQELVRP